MCFLGGQGEMCFSSRKQSLISEAADGRDGHDDAMTTGPWAPKEVNILGKKGHEVA